MTEFERVDVDAEIETNCKILKFVKWKIVTVRQQEIVIFFLIPGSTLHLVYQVYISILKVTN